MDWRCGRADREAVERVALAVLRRGDVEHDVDEDEGEDQLDEERRAGLDLDRAGQRIAQEVAEGARLDGVHGAHLGGRILRERGQHHEGDCSPQHRSRSRGQVGAQAIPRDGVGNLERLAPIARCQ